MFLNLKRLELQSEIMAHVHDHIEEHGYLPIIEEVASHHNTNYTTVFQILKKFFPQWKTCRYYLSKNEMLVLEYMRREEIATLKQMSFDLNIEHQTAKNCAMRLVEKRYLKVKRKKDEHTTGKCLLIFSITEEGR